jgi:hypothetical protein
MSRLLAPALLLAAACATAPRGVPLAMGSPPPTSVDLASAYQPEGEVFAVYGRGAGVANSYGRNRVVGPETSLSRNLEGRWGGTLSGHSVLLDVADGRIRGAGVELTVRRDGSVLLVAGLWRGSRMDLEFGKDHIGGTPGAGCSIDLRPSEGAAWRGFLACPKTDVAVLRLAGAAVDVPDVAMPQWLLAFLGALPEIP